MIGYLRGTIFEKSPNQLILDANGVGYEILIPISTYTAIGDIGKSASLRIHTHVREDALQLFGFATTEEKALFERLISVSGIGPKLAITVLSGLPAGELLQAIRTSDLQTLVRIPGIGKKTAERIVLELRDKVAHIQADGKASPAVTPGPALSSLEQDVLSALLNLGCSRAAAEEAIRKAKTKPIEEGFEPLFRASLAMVR